MICKECKYGELTQDISTGMYFYLCTNEMVTPSSKIFVDCPSYEEKKDDTKQ